MELQDHRPLHDAVGDRHVGIVEVQSGNNWGRVISVTFPGDGAQNIRIEPVTANRAPNVAILDIRVDKSFRFGKFGKLTGQVDVFNMLNSGAVTVFRTTTGATFKEVLACSTRASCGSASATTSKSYRSGEHPALAGRGPGHRVVRPFFLYRCSLRVAPGCIWPFPELPFVPITRTAFSPRVSAFRVVDCLVVVAARPLCWGVQK